MPVNSMPIATELKVHCPVIHHPGHPAHGRNGPTQWCVFFEHDYFNDKDHNETIREWCTQNVPVMWDRRWQLAGSYYVTYNDPGSLGQMFCMVSFTNETDATMCYLAFR